VAHLLRSPVTLDAFRSLLESLVRDVPATFRDGIVAITVSPKTVPDPLRGEVYTLGECVPLEWSGGGADLQSRIVLYYGSFAALARHERGHFDWGREVWETLSHELRHHLEWRANVAALEAYDWALEQNLARQAGEPFDPVFYRSGESLGPGIYKVEDDVFLEWQEGGGTGAQPEFIWHGRRYRAPEAPGVERPLFLTLEGLAAAPAGDVVLVVPWKPSLIDVWSRPPVVQRVARAEAVRG